MCSFAPAGLSREINFTMVKEPTLRNLPFTLAIFADTGVNNASDLNIKGKRSYLPACAACEV
jgi:hypothetical protein